MCKTKSEDPNELPQNNNNPSKGKGGNSFPESNIENIKCATHSISINDISNIIMIIRIIHEVPVSCLKLATATHSIQ